MSTEFKLNTDIKNRATVITNINRVIDDLPVDKEWSVSIEAANETRRSKQNRIHRRWCGEIELHVGQTPGYGHAHTKYHVLLPMKLSSDDKKIRERAEYECAYLEMIENVPQEYLPDYLAHLSPYERKLRSAYDHIRSKNITVKPFAEWLNEYKRQWAEQGLILICKSPNDHEALMR